MNRSRLRLALLLSALAHVLVLGLLRFIPLTALTRPAASTSDAPVAVQLLELPSQSQPQIAQTPERTRKLPEAPVRKLEPKAPQPPAPPRASEPATPKPAAPPPKGGTVVDLPKPVREEWRRPVTKAGPAIGTRVCALCGASEKDGADIRVCSCEKCGAATNGKSRELCLEHARNH